MKIVNLLFMLCFCLGISQNVEAQSKQHQKWQEAVDALSRSEFIQEYRKMKNKIETQVAAFHQYKAEIHVDEFEEVGKHYTDVVEDFDVILNDLKNRFKNKMDRESMLRKPDDYTKYYKPALDSAKINYNNTCAVKIDAHIDNGDSAVGITEITAVIALVGELVKIVDKYQKKMEDMSGTYLEDNLIRDLRLKKWKHYK